MPEENPLEGLEQIEKPSNPVPETDLPDTPPESKEDLPVVPTEEEEEPKAPEASDENSQEEPEETPKAEDDDPNAQEEPKEEPSTEALETQLGQLSEGRLTTFADVQALISENKQLKTDLENAKPTFETEQGKRLYEFASKYRGENSAAALQFFHVMDLEPENMSDKDKLFEAFALKDEYLGIARADLKEAFDEIYDDKYATESKASQLQLKADLVQAEKVIAQKREEFGASLSEQQEAAQQAQDDEDAVKLQQVTDKVDAVLPTLDKLTFKFGEEDESFNFTLTDDDKGDSLKNALVDPRGNLERVLESFIREDGSFDHEGHAKWAALRSNPEKLIEAAIAHGVNIGIARKLKELKNPSDPKTKDAPAKEELGKWEEIIQGVQGKLPNPFK
jgi:hypothetical protein